MQLEFVGNREEALNFLLHKYRQLELSNNFTQLLYCVEYVPKVKTVNNHVMTSALCKKIQENFAKLLTSLLGDVMVILLS